jgi:Sec-independent protein translocase protein TatA
MTNVSIRERTGATRGKLALVGVLAVVLVVVIVVQLPGPSNVDKAATTAVSSLAELDKVDNDKAESNSETKQTKKTRIDTPPRQWPELSMDTIIAFDPLTAPSWYVAAARVEPTKEQDDPSLAAAEDDARAAALATLQQTGTTIVLIANGERIATIGDQSVRIGDSIEGFQVSDITDQGVILTRPGPK